MTFYSQVQRSSREASWQISFQALEEERWGVLRTYHRETGERWNLDRPTGILWRSYRPLRSHENGKDNDRMNSPKVRRARWEVSLGHWTGWRLQRDRILQHTRLRCNRRLHMERWLIWRLQIRRLQRPEISNTWRLESSPSLFRSWQSWWQQMHLGLQRMIWRAREHTWYVQLEKR